MFLQYAQKLAYMVLSIVLTRTLARTQDLFKGKNFIHDLEDSFPTEFKNLKISLPENKYTVHVFTMVRKRGVAQVAESPILGVY